MSQSTQHQKIDFKQVFNPKSLMFIVLGVISATIALQGFMIPNHFLDGGVTGISILIHEYFDFPIYILLLVLNLPFVYIGYKKIGKTFAVQTSLAILLLTVSMYFIKIPDAFTNDKLLIAIFGGLLIGLGIGLVIRGGAVIDGLEVLADYTHKKSGFSTSEIILSVNSVLFLGIAFKFGIESAMYSILTYYTAMKISDYVVDGFEEFTALSIISKEHDKVKSVIVNDFNKAITVYKGERGYLPGKFHISHDCDIVMTIVTRLEVHRLRQALVDMDPQAFFFVQSIKEVKGGVMSKNTAHH